MPPSSSAPPLAGRLRLPERLQVAHRWVRPAAAARASRPSADPVLAAYLNEQLAAATTLADELRRAALREELTAERTTLLGVRRELTADRAVLRTAMRRLDVGTDWSVQGVTWASGKLTRLLPLLHRLPVVERIPGTRPSREGAVQALLVLEELLGGLHRRAVAAGLLAELVRQAPGVEAGAVAGLPARAAAQTRTVEAVHRRCAAPLFTRPAAVPGPSSD